MFASLLKSATRPFVREPEGRAGAIELCFVLPSDEIGPRPPQFYTDEFKRELAGMAEAPLDQLRRLRTEVSGLFRSGFLAVDRLDRTRQGVAAALPLIQLAMRRHGKEGGIPDSMLRSKSLDHCTAILAMLGSSYAAVFKHHYEKSGAHFARNIEEAHLCACRVLELARLEQRVRALRYQPPRDELWCLVNTLFHIMREQGDVEKHVPVLESDAFSAHSGRFTSLSAQFVALHMTARLDPLRWPVAAQAWLAGYLDSHLELIKLRDDPGGNLKTAQMLAYCHARHAAGARLADAPDARALLLDWTRLAARMREDCAALVRASKESNRLLAPKTLRLLTSLESLAFAQLLLTGMQRVEQAEAVDEHEEKVLGIQIYVSFREVYLLIHHIVSKRAQTLGKRFIDHFAERSAMIARDHTTESESIWYVLHQNRNIIRLKTEESEFTTALAVGDLISYALGAQDSHRPRLAVVRRLYRPDGTHVIIDLERLAKYAEPVTITPLADGKPEGDAIPALLMFDPDIGCNLLFSPKASVIDKNEARLAFRGQPHDFTLSGLKYVTGGMYMYRMPLRMSQLGLDASPQYPEPSAPVADPEAV